MKIAYLKSIVKRPDLCEGWDVTAPDPIILLFLKAYKKEDFFKIKEEF